MTLYTAFCSLQLSRVFSCVNLLIVYWRYCYHTDRCSCVYGE